MTKHVNVKYLVVTFWNAYNNLRDFVENSEYKHLVLGLIFLKFASDKFEDRKVELIAEGKKKYSFTPNIKKQSSTSNPYYSRERIKIYKP